MKKTLALVFSLFYLSACDQYGQGGGNPNQPVSKGDVGTLLGAVGGAYLGSKVGKGDGRLVGVAAGTLLGAALGRSVGQSLDKADMGYHESAAQRALETGQPGERFPWQNPESGHSGMVTPSNYYQNAQGQYCREYTQQVMVGGHAEEAYGHACRQPDGQWKLVQ